MKPITAITLDDMRHAQERIKGIALQTPLIALQRDTPGPNIYLKLENLQPIGSFKLRGAANAMRAIDVEQLSQGVWTASAGNMAQGVAWVARQLNVPCHVVVPDHAPKTKLEAIERLGATWEAVTFERWWQVIETSTFPGARGSFIHPVCDPRVIAGNATIGLEIAEQLPEVDTVLVPYGGGALSCGVASAMSQVKPNARVFAAEVETAAPLSASLAAGRPAAVDYQPSFVDGIGGRGLLEPMWPLVSTLLKGSCVVSLDQVADALRHLALRHRVIAEGAGAAPVAAALANESLGKRIVCVVSGGNIDVSTLTTILGGATP